MSSKKEEGDRDFEMEENDRFLSDLGKYDTDDLEMDNFDEDENI